MGGPSYPWAEETLGRLLRRWAVAALLVATAHAGIAYAIMHWPKAAIPAGEPPAAIMIDMAPVPMAPDTPPQEVAVGPTMEMSKVSTPSEQKDEPVEEIEPEKEVAKLARVEEVPELEVETEVDVPELPVVENAEAALPPAAVKPRPETEIAEDSPPPPQPQRKPERSEEREKEAAKNSPTTAAPKPFKAKRAKTNAAPSSGVSSSVSLSSWRGRVMAHLNRRKRKPRGGGRGTSSVAFVIDRSGRVVSARLIRSSGSRALDQAAVSLARRASPVPAPPGKIRGGRITLTVPIRFTR
jgi:periplasmic protein TonB